MIKAITFDLDDTLWPILPVILRAEKSSKRWLIDNYPAMENVLGEDIVTSVRKDLIYKNPDLTNQLSRLRTLSVRELAKRAGYDTKIAEKIGEDAFKIFFSYRNKVVFYDNVLQVLDSLKSKYILGSLTNGNADLKKIGLDRVFSFHFSSSDLNASKPDPDHFLAAIRETGLKPEEICHVGDNFSHDVLGARNTGLKAIWFNNQGLKSNQNSIQVPEISSWLELENQINSLT
jgi:HAD superfamily hydrolase (TIGR01549 family)